MNSNEQTIEIIAAQEREFDAMALTYKRLGEEADSAEDEAEFVGKSNAYSYASQMMRSAQREITAAIEEAQERDNAEREASHYAALEALGND